MAPPFKEPPPYSAEDIKHITDPQEQLRAMAELSSYIARVKKLKAEGLGHGVDGLDGYVGYDSSAPPSPYRGNTGASDSYHGHDHVSRPQRGSYGRSRGGYAGYHPYGRSSAPFRNKSVIFNKPGSSDETSASKKDTPAATSEAHVSHDRQRHLDPNNLCPAFTSTGVCSRHVCRRIHDPARQAICRTWLFKGTCPQGDGCALSHESTHHNAPTCQHFQQGRCNNDDCRFSHVRISPAAMNCEAFGVLGYCEKGTDCFELHAHECPHFSNTGSCYYGDHCRLGHVRRASRLRRAARQTSEGLSSSSESSVDDAEELEDAETWTGATDTTQEPHHFTQQADFVALDRED